MISVFAPNIVNGILVTIWGNFSSHLGFSAQIVIHLWRAKEKFCNMFTFDFFFSKFQYFSSSFNPVFHVNFRHLKISEIRSKFWFYHNVNWLWIDFEKISSVIWFFHSEWVRNSSHIASRMWVEMNTQYYFKLNCERQLMVIQAQLHLSLQIMYMKQFETYFIMIYSNLVRHNSFTILWCGKWNLIKVLIFKYFWRALSLQPQRPCSLSFKLQLNFWL